MTVQNAVHIHVATNGISMMMLIDGIYEEHWYRTWDELLYKHPITLGRQGDRSSKVHIFVRG